MKKTINTIICGVMSFFVFATPLQVKSQTIPYQAITEKNDINTHINPILPITKSLYPQMALTYYEHYGASTPINNVRGVFLRNNAAQSIDSFLVPDNIYITDFVELPEDGRIFFCGYKNISVTEPKSIGIIGYFNYDFISPTSLVFNYTEVPEVFSFTKVEAFNVNGVISEVDIDNLSNQPKPFTFLPLQIPIINKYITIDCLSF